MPEKVSKDMQIGEAVRLFPETAPIMLKYGLHCVGCHVAAFESIEQGAKAHGLTDTDLEKMISEMNEEIESKNEEKR